jgi:hypothetical protein
VKLAEPREAAFVVLLDPPRLMAATMIQDTSATVQQAFLEAVRPNRRPFSVTRVIGGKLRALYDDDAQLSADLDALMITWEGASALVPN